MLKYFALVADAILSEAARHFRNVKHSSVVQGDNNGYMDALFSGEPEPDAADLQAESAPTPARAPAHEEKHEEAGGGPEAEAVRLEGEATQAADTLQAAIVALAGLPAHASEPEGDFADEEARGAAREAAEVQLVANRQAAEAEVTRLEEERARLQAEAHEARALVNAALGEPADPVVAPENVDHSGDDAPVVPAVGGAAASDQAAVGVNGEPLTTQIVDAGHVGATAATAPVESQNGDVAVGEDHVP